MTRNNSLKVFAKAIKSYDRFILSTHIMPEGDAIGSLLAMESLLRKLGKKTLVVCEDEFPHRLNLLYSKKWNQLKQVKQKPSAFDALITVDCPTLERIGKVKDWIDPETKIFNIDHHLSNNFFGDYNFVRPKASATGEVVYEIFKQFCKPINMNEAKNIYVAISTDTGSFKYTNTTVESHKIASELMKTGLDVEAINDEVYSQYSLNKIKLYGQLLSRVHLSVNKKVAWTSMMVEDLKRTGTTYEDAEGFIDFLRYMKSVKMCFFIMEIKKNKEVRVSFRSKGTYDVNQVASEFGGGGHKKAAGCMLKNTVKDTEKEILAVIKKKVRFK